MTDADTDAAMTSVHSSGIFNMYLSELNKSILVRPMNWETYWKASMLDESELASIQTFDAVPVHQLPSLRAPEVEAYTKLSLALIAKISRVDSVQYLLRRLDLLLSACPKLVLDCYRSGNPGAFTAPLLRCLGKEDDYIVLSSAKLLAELFCLSGSLPDDIIVEYMRWIVQQLGNPKAQNHLDLAIQCLHCLLRNTTLRPMVWNYPKCVERLSDLLTKGSPSPQLQYQVILCFWLLSFNAQAAAGIQKKFDLLPVLLDIARSSIKEKVIRVCLATMRNMLSLAPEVNTLPMIGHKVVTLCENFANRKWGDDDIKDDVSFLDTELRKTIQNLSTFDEYLSEVKSGKLDWSPAHNSEHFWKNNAAKFADKDQELLRMLTRILVTSTNPMVLAVACHDMGQFVKFYPQGKKAFQDLGAKQQIMQLMTHENNDVRYHALLAVQNYMLNVWGS